MEMYAWLFVAIFCFATDCCMVYLWGNKQFRDWWNGQNDGISTGVAFVSIIVGIGCFLMFPVSMWQTIVRI